MDPGLAQAISEAQAVHELRAEIERLRAALVLIATMDDEDDEWDGRDRFHRARGAARSALTNKQRDT